MPLVFVYGTLKRGGSNHGLLRGQRLLASARTRGGFRLFDLGGYPGLVEAPAGGRAVEGELWAVDARCLERLDRLEDTAGGLYARARIALQAPCDGLRAEAYLYRRNVAGRRDLGVRYGA
jgi:gamma-glutamylaminecyclotransferase